MQQQGMQQQAMQQQATVFITVTYKASRVDYAVLNNSLLHHSGVQSIKQHTHALLRLAAVRIF